MTHMQTLINRELSWLSFNHRVLQEANDPTVPLVERMRFLGIFSNNLDEFFKVRVATIKRMIDVQHGSQRVEGIKPQKLMAKIQKKVLELQHTFQKIYNTILLELEKENIFIVNDSQINNDQREYVTQYFKEQVRPVISPIMLNNLNSGPYLKDYAIYLAIKLSTASSPDETEYALMEIPSDAHPRFKDIPSNDNSRYVMLLEDIIRVALPDIFSIFNYDTFEAWTVKLTRDAELDMDNDLSQSLLETITKGVSGRKTGQPVRFVYDATIADDLLEYIIKKIGLEAGNNLIAGGRYHNFKDFISFPNLGDSSLEYEKLPPLPHPKHKPGSSIIKLMKKQDFLLHVPYQDFNVFISLLQEASIDPKVEEISLTIYRVARNSKVINALLNACRNGKKVRVIIELQARFDEESNIYWSRVLEEEGAEVLFGFPNLKVHAKLLHITRIEDKKPESYCCVSTGNFHEGNASVYSDFILFTSDKRITREIKQLFEFFVHTYRNQSFKHLIASPNFMRTACYDLIDAEIKNATQGKEAYIILKLNSLVDKDIIDKLYEANNAGVKITLNIRGTCSLLPGVPGLSENIEAISIIDRFLEHSRIMIFGNGGEELCYISSADWMTRNLDRRIEIACPIYDKKIQSEIRDIIRIQQNDNVKARVIDVDQENVYVTNTEKTPIRCQMEIYNYYTHQLKDR